MSGRTLGGFDSFYCLNTASIPAHLADVTVAPYNASALMLLVPQNK